MDTPNSQPTRQLSVRLSPATHARIKQLATRFEVPQADIIEAAFSLPTIGEGIRQTIANNLQAQAQRLRALPDPTIDQPAHTNNHEPASRYPYDC